MKAKQIILEPSSETVITQEIKPENRDDEMKEKSKEEIKKDDETPKENNDVIDLEKENIKYKIDQKDDNKEVKSMEEEIKKESETPLTEKKMWLKLLRTKPEMNDSYVEKSEEIQKRNQRKKRWKN